MWHQPAICFQMSNPDRFAMLKTWLVNSSLDSIEVEERYRKVLRDDRTDRYVTMSIFQLEQKYGSDPEAQKFITDITKGAVFCLLMGEGLPISNPFQCYNHMCHAAAPPPQIACQASRGSTILSHRTRKQGCSRFWRMCLKRKVRGPKLNRQPGLGGVWGRLKPRRRSLRNLRKAWSL